MRRSETSTTTDHRSDDQTRAHCSRSLDCPCGQQLDVSLRAHCPRCGRSVNRS